MKVGQKVKYCGKKTEITEILDTEFCLIFNPDFDEGLNYECINQDVEYGIPYIIRVKLTDLK